MKPSEKLRPVISMEEERTGTEFNHTRTKIIMKTSANHPLPSTYGLTIVDAIRANNFNTDLCFDVELSHDQVQQSLLCGLVTPDYKLGVAIAFHPSTGAIVDVLNGTGAMGYLSSAPLLPGQSIRFSLHVQKYGRNHLCSVQVENQTLTVPAFVSGEELIFNAMVGTDIGSGSVVQYRNPRLAASQMARVA